MKGFITLLHQVDATTSTKAKVAALTRYFNQASDSDKRWAIALFSHRRPKRAVTTTKLRAWAAEVSHIPEWLFEETYHVVGDLAETIAKVVEQKQPMEDHSLTYWITYIIDLYEKDEEEQKTAVVAAWQSLSETGRFIFNKLITGGLRMGISQKLMIRALAQHTGQTENELALKLMGAWQPQNTTYKQLILEEDTRLAVSRPYPFFLAYALDKEVEELGPIDNWQIEYKWDGIRAQIIHRQGQVFVWSRGQELLNDAFPEMVELGAALPNGTVLDGELVAYKDGQLLPFGELQRRIGRKKASKAMQQKVPVALIAYDVLETQGKDCREQTQEKRRARLVDLVETSGHATLLLSETIPAESWQALGQRQEQARAKRAEGLMLKRKQSPYGVGRKKGPWYKWKVDPYTIDAVMLYAMRGHGRRANLYTDYTFAVRDGENLVPVAKAYSGLTDAEIRKVDAFVKKNTVERFGPVRSVTPQLVFEIAFEGIRRSSRHKSGIALRFPRISRWRTDKTVEDIDTLENLKAFLPKQEE